LKVHFCGVRGSTPVCGSQFERIGGDTSCVAIAHDDQPWSLVLDGGTGLRSLTDLLGDQPFRGSILLGHLHLDHTQGLPFFAAGDRDDARVQVLVPEQGVEALELLSRCYSPPHFPITLSAMLGNWSFATIDAGSHRIEGFEVLAADVSHPGGRTFGYRISDGTSTTVYISDHAPDLLPGSFDVAVDLARGADVLIHDSQFTDDEQVHRVHYGHSTPSTALRIAEAAGVARLVLFHHAPARSDVEVEQMAGELRSSTVDVIIGREGLMLDLS
jgi:ribonuclease BN (tRNA processing enzyme)